MRARQAEVDVAEAKVDPTMIQFFPRVTLQATHTRLSPVTSDFAGGALVGAGNPGLLATGPCPGGAGTCVLDSAGQPVGAAKFAIENLENSYALTGRVTVPLSDYVSGSPRLRRHRARASVPHTLRSAPSGWRCRRTRASSTTTGCGRSGASPPPASRGGA